MLTESSVPAYGVALIADDDWRQGVINTVSEKVEGLVLDLIQHTAKPDTFVVVSVKPNGETYMTHRVYPESASPTALAVGEYDLSRREAEESVAERAARPRYLLPPLPSLD